MKNDFLNINININKKEEKQVYSFSNNIPKGTLVSLFQTNRLKT